MILVRTPRNGGIGACNRPFPMTRLGSQYNWDTNPATKPVTHISPCLKGLLGLGGQEGKRVGGRNEGEGREGRLWSGYIV